MCLQPAKRLLGIDMVGVQNILVYLHKSMLNDNTPIGYVVHRMWFLYKRTPNVFKESQFSQFFNTINTLLFTGLHLRKWNDSFEFGNFATATWLVIMWLRITFYLSCKTSHISINSNHMASKIFFESPAPQMNTGHSVLSILLADDRDFCRTIITW